MRFSMLCSHDNVLLATNAAGTASKRVVMCEFSGMESPVSHRVVLATLEGRWRVVGGPRGALQAPVATS